MKKKRVDGRNPMAFSKCNDIAGERACHWSVVDDERLDGTFGHLHEGALDLTNTVGSEDQHIKPEALRSRLYAVIRHVWPWACQEGDCCGFRDQLMEEAQSLANKFLLSRCHASDIAARLAEAGNEPIVYRIATVIEHNGDRRGGRFRSAHRGPTCANNYNVHMAFDECGCER